MATAPLRVGLIGLGSMGQNHLRVLSLLKSVDLRFVHDTSGEVAARAAAASGVAAAGDLDRALAEVDAVVLATPTSTHADYIRRIAPRVRRIFVEKPLADSLAESAAVREMAGRDGLQIQVGFIERFNPAVVQLRRILERSAQVVSMDFTRTNKVSSRITDVDVITDLMIHDIDLALHLNGPVRDVHAHGVAHGSMIEFASALLTHANGRFSRIQASRITEKKIRRIQATCMDMYVDCELLRKEIIINKQSEVRQSAGEPYVITAVEEAVEVKPQEALLSELQAFVAWCQGGPTAVPTAEDGHAAMVLCDRIQRAVLGAAAAAAGR